MGKEDVKERILSGFLWLFAFGNIVYEFYWLYVFYNETYEWFQAPIPNYGTLLGGYHYVRLVTCIVIAFLLRPILQKRESYEKHLNKYCIPITFAVHSIILILEAIYDFRFIYVFGYDFSVMFGTVLPIPLVIVLFLVMKNKMSGMVAACFPVIELILYVLYKWDENLFIRPYRPYYDFYSRAIFCVVLVLLFIRKGQKNELNLPEK